MPKYKRHLVTAALIYANGPIHIGHLAGCYIPADIYVRFLRSKGEDVKFVSGTDEHGVKIQEAAQKEGLSPQEFTDKISLEFKKAWQNLNISHNSFIRTTSAKHKKIVLQILKKLKEKDVLYEADYKGLYCIGCEKFLTSNDLKDGQCPDHQREPEELKEKNWFFKLSKFLPKIKELIESGELIIYPEGRKKEVLGLIGSNHILIIKGVKVVGEISEEDAHAHAQARKATEGLEIGMIISFLDGAWKGEEARITQINEEDELLTVELWSQHIPIPIKNVQASSVKAT